MQTTLFFLHPTLMRYRRKQKLEHNISKIIDFFSKSQLMVNKQKTEYIVVSIRKRLTNTVSNIENERIAESNCVKYLGVIIDSKLKFDGEAKKIQRFIRGRPFLTEEKTIARKISNFATKYCQSFFSWNIIAQKIFLLTRQRSSSIENLTSL